MRYKAILALAFVLVASFAAAHMNVVKSAPAADSTVTKAPSSIQIWFTQVPDVAVSKLTMTGPDGDVPLNGLHAMEKSLMAMVGGKMADGSYTVSWQTAGDDGHIQRGELAFTLKR